MRLENWSIIAHEFDPYQAPERVSKGLHGQVYGHESLEDGSLIYTSRVVHVNAAAGTVTTRTGSLYTLGKVDPAYEALYPNAFARLCKPFGV